MSQMNTKYKRKVKRKCNKATEVITKKSGGKCDVFFESQ